MLTKLTMLITALATKKIVLGLLGKIDTSFSTSENVFPSYFSLN